MARVDLQPVAIGLIDERWGTSNIDSTRSSYDESGARPGSAVANTNVQDAVPIITGSQSYAIDLSVTKSGDPSIHERGAAVAWKLDSEANTEWRGWSDVNLVTSARCLYADTTDAMVDVDTCTLPKSQTVMSVFNTNDASDHTLVRTLDESTQEFGASTTVVSTGRGPSTIFALPDDKVLVLDVRGNTTDGPVVMVDANGDGAGWETYSSEPFPTAVAGTPARARARYANEQVMCWIQNASDLLQYASSDLGATYTLVSSFANALSFGLTATPAGTFVLAYISAADDKIYVKRFGNAFQSQANTSTIEVASVTNTTETYEIELTCDSDGRLYLFMSHPCDFSEGDVGRTQVYMSANDGSSWSLLSNGPVFPGSNGSNNDVRFQKLSATWSRGRCYLIGERDNGPEGLVAFTLSGWSNINNGESHTTGGRNCFTTTTGSGSSSAVTTAGMWFPVALPWGSASGYATNDPGAGTATLTGGPDSQHLQLAGGASIYFDATLASATTASVDRVCIFRMKCTTNNSVGTNIKVGAQMNNVLAGGSNRSTVDLRFRTTALRLVDQQSETNRVDLTIDCTEYRDYMIRMNETAVEAYYRDDASDNWTSIGTLTLTSSATSTGYTTQFVKWGNFMASRQSEWEFFAHQFNGSSASVNFLAKARNFTKAIGKRITSTGYPLPGVGSTSLVSRLKYVGAFARVKEEASGDYTITPERDYGISSVFPQESPSPTKVWKSLTASASSNQVLVCDFGAVTRFDEKLPFVVVQNANWKSANVEYSTNGTDYTSAGTINLAYGFESSTFTRTGDVVVPSSGSAVTGARWMHADEFVGGTALLTDGGTTTAHEIASNTAGDWKTGSSVVGRLRLADTTSAAASGSIDIVAPSGVFVMSSLTDVDIRYIRITITASATPSGYFEAGTIAVGSCFVPGKRWARGWSLRTEPVVESSVDSHGTTRIKQKGPNRRSLTMNWDHGALMGRVRSSISSVDYVSATSGSEALAGRDDVWWQLEGLLDRAKGGELPVVAIQEVPATTSTITDKSMYLFGLLESSVTVNHVNGDSGSNEFVRIEAIKVTELT